MERPAPALAAPCPIESDSMAQQATSRPSKPSRPSSLAIAHRCQLLSWLILAQRKEVGREPSPHAEAEERRYFH